MRYGGTASSTAENTTRIAALLAWTSMLTNSFCRESGSRATTVRSPTSVRGKAKDQSEDASAVVASTRGGKKQTASSRGACGSGQWNGARSSGCRTPLAATDACSFQPTAYGNRLMS